LRAEVARRLGRWELDHETWDEPQRLRLEAEEARRRVEALRLPPQDEDDGPVPRLAPGLAW